MQFIYLDSYLLLKSDKLRNLQMAECTRDLQSKIFGLTICITEDYSDTRTIEVR